jgi:hypothetical protein
VTEELVDPKAETRKLKLFKMLGPKAGGSMQIGYEAGKLAAMGDKSGAAQIADLLMQQGQV